MLLSVLNMLLISVSGVVLQSRAEKSRAIQNSVLSLPRAVWSPSPVLLSPVQVTPLHLRHCFPPLDERIHPSYLLIFAWFSSTSSILPGLAFFPKILFHSLPGVPLYPGGDGEAFSPPDEGRAVVTGLGLARPLLGALAMSHFMRSFRQQIVLSTDDVQALFPALERRC